jgi:hypothetical protein
VSDRARIPGGVVSRVLALVIGAVIGFIDSRPHWDDTGVTAAMVLLSAAVLAGIWPRLHWQLACCIAIPIVLFNLVTTGRVDAVVAIVIALIGSALGRAIGTAIRPSHPRSSE